MNAAMSGRWDPPKVLKFIRLYQENECLWNTKSVFYKKKTARDNAYRRMLQGMMDETMTKTTLQNKIRTLRNTYLHEYKKVKESKKLGLPSHVYKPKLSWYDEMDFLANYIEERDAVSPEHFGPASPSSTVDTDLQNDPLQSFEDICSEIYIKDEFVEIEEDDIEENSIQQQKEVDNTDMLNSCDNECLESIIERPVSKKRKSEVNIPIAPKNLRNFHNINSNIDSDEFYYFGLSIAAQLKNMPLENALQIQAKIQNLLTNERCEVLRNPSTDHNNIQHFNSASVQDNSCIENKGRFGVPAVYNNAAGNETQTCNTEPSTSTFQKAKKPMSVVDFNSPNNQILRTLHTVTENQLRMQEQLYIIQNSCDRSREYVLEKTLRQNLVISKESLKTLKKLFGEGLSPIEEEMGSLFPLSNFPEIEDLENKIKVKENEDALKTYLVSKKGNQNVDSLFRNLITDELLDAFNWDGRSGKKPLKSLKLFDIILNDIYCHMSRKDYETEVRKFVELSHNRAKQKRIKQQICKDQL